MKTIGSVGILAIVLGSALAPTAATAAIEEFVFSTTYNGGPLSGDTPSGEMLLDVVGGVATSGTLTRISHRRGMVFRDPTMIAQWPWRGRARPWRGLRGWGSVFWGSPVGLSLIHI